MAVEPSFAERNARYAAGFEGGDLKIPPRLNLLILSCVDARVEPAELLDLEIGDAFILRNVGARVTDEVIRHIRILQYLGSLLADGEPLEVALIHHTDCGTLRFSKPEVNEALSKALDTDSSAIEALASTDPFESVRIDLERLRAAAILPDELRVSAHVYDVKTGSISEVVPSAPLR